MGAIVSAYLVDLNQLRAVYGSRDTALLRDVETRFANELAEWEATASSVKPASSRPTVREALREIVEGEIPTEGDGSPYGYALDLLCQYLGTSLPNEELGDLQSEGIAALESVERLHDLSDGWRPPLPLPYPRDVLGITYITVEEARAALDRLPPVELSLPVEPDDAWDDDTLDRWEEEWPLRLQKQYRAWMEEAVRTDKDIVLTLY